MHDSWIRNMVNRISSRVRFRPPEGGNEADQPAKAIRPVDVHRIIHAILGPWCRENGFKKMKTGMLAYTKPLGQHHICFWIQCDCRGWDKYAGSKFTMEFQADHSPVLGLGGVRKRFPEFLSKKQLEWVRARQNQVIRGIPKPPREWLERYDRIEWQRYPVSLEVAKAFRREWEPVKDPYPEGYDVWLRYWTTDDVGAWADFLLGLLPGIVAQISKTPPAAPQS